MAVLLLQCSIDAALRQKIFRFLLFAVRETVRLSYGGVMTQPGERLR